MRLLVTGGNGLVGSRLCALLASQGHQVTGLGRGERRARGSFEFTSVELTQRESVLAAFEQVRPEAVIHTASMTEVDACEKAPRQAFDANVTAVANVAEACRSLEAHLVHVSTDYVFDGEEGPYGPTDRPNPRGVYAVTKHLGEQAALAFCPSAAIARTAVVYGWPPAARPNFGSWLVTALRAGTQVRLFEDQFVSPSLAANVAEMLAELAVRRLGGVWNTCGAEIVNRVQFAQGLCEVFGFDPTPITPTRLADLKLASPRPAHSGLTVDDTCARLEAQPLGLRPALEAFHEEFRRE